MCHRNAHTHVETVIDSRIREDTFHCPTFFEGCSLISRGEGEGMVRGRQDRDV